MDAKHADVLKNFAAGKLENADLALVEKLALELSAKYKQN